MYKLSIHIGGLMSQFCKNSYWESNPQGFIQKEFVQSRTSIADVRSAGCASTLTDRPPPISHQSIILQSLDYSNMKRWYPMLYPVDLNPCQPPKTIALPKVLHRKSLQIITVMVSWSYITAYFLGNFQNRRAKVGMVRRLLHLFVHPVKFSHPLDPPKNPRIWRQDTRCLT